MLPEFGDEGRLIPSLCVLDQPYGFRFAVCEMGCWRCLDAIGGIEIELAEVAKALQVDAAAVAKDPNLDFFDLSSPLLSSRGSSTGSIPEQRGLLLFLKLPAEVLPDDIGLLLAVTLIMPDAGEWIPWTSHEMTATAVKAVGVRPLSQMEQDPAFARHICSPVNTLMVARHLTGWEIALAPFVAAAHSMRRQMFGIWPRAIAAAAGQGVAGMVTALAGWGEVAALLQAGLPVIATIAYAEGELAGAAVNATRGHLVTICGLTETTVIVNDPAAPIAAEVRREYDLDEFAKAWFRNKSGVCYVLWK